MDAWTHGTDKRREKEMIRDPRFTKLTDTSRVSIQVTELAVFGHDLPRVDCGVAFAHAVPPLHAVVLGEI